MKSLQPSSIAVEHPSAGQVNPFNDGVGLQDGCTGAGWDGYNDNDAPDWDGCPGDD